MGNRTASSTKSPEPTLIELIQVIVARDDTKASRLLAKSPMLAQQALEVGAARETANEYFFESIAHYAYAGDTALHLAAAAYEARVAEALLANGADVRARNRRGAEPLHYAVDGGPGSPGWNPDAQAVTIALLLRAGASISAADKSGVLPLHRAVRTRCAAAVRALLDHGADARAKNKSGSTPLHLAVQTTGRSDSGSVAAHEQQKEIIELLLAHGARASDRSSLGKSVKDSANAEWIRVLLG
jgi:ankyrin repeat protein